LRDVARRGRQDVIREAGKNPFGEGNEKPGNQLKKKNGTATTGKKSSKGGL